MPTLLEDAQDVSAAMRNFADSLREAAEPGDIYPMLGELLGTSRSLTAVFNRISVALADHRPQATDDQGNPEAGTNAVQHTLIRLREARSLAVQLEAALVQASQAAGTIAWRAPAPAPAPAPQPPRYVNIMFLQGEDADRIIEIINRHGPDTAFAELAGHDHGDETVDAALENGYVYDQPPTGQLDQVATRDVYTMVYNPFMGHVGLYREHDALPDPVLLGIEDPPAHVAPNTATTAAAAPVREASRTDRLGTPRVGRAAYPTRASLRGLGA
ncbi:hypothetical protein MUN77_03320 [Leucobacter allii]|uniref:hypothetical protein n=1 Tax=Leucobacter allii TaxID=2932247 RepID=UPI001FD143AB|nr:hypothetical protein [Leucobacter allii]UOR02361.1 hypothetical protein MUN77_03320 [Leucobacter allii]